MAAPKDTQGTSYFHLLSSYLSLAFYPNKTLPVYCCTRDLHSLTLTFYVLRAIQDRWYWSAKPQWYCSIPCNYNSPEPTKINMLTLRLYALIAEIPASVTISKSCSYSHVQCLVYNVELLNFFFSFLHFKIYTILFTWYPIPYPAWVSPHSTTCIVCEQLRLEPCSTSCFCKRQSQNEEAKGMNTEFKAEQVDRFLMGPWDNRMGKGLHEGTHEFGVTGWARRMPLLTFF